MIRLTREKRISDKLRVYKIFIDEIYHGDIKSGETKDFDIDKGKHIIYAKIDWCRSNKLDITIDDSILELEVGPSLAGTKVWIPLIQFLYITFWKNKYLWIKEK